MDDTSCRKKQKGEIRDIVTRYLYYRWSDILVLLKGEFKIKIYIVNSRATTENKNKSKYNWYAKREISMESYKCSMKTRQQKRTKPEQMQ